jgi:phosphoribosylanthranilate isomerase
VLAGADAIGLVFTASKRQLAISDALVILAALPPLFPVVGVFRDQTAADVQEVLSAVPLTHLQFHGGETAEYCQQFGRPWVRAVSLCSGADLPAARQVRKDHQGAGLLIDAATGGSGQTCDWAAARELAAEGPVILAGGLTPGNVAAAIAAVHPAAVDVASGVERAPREKDHELIRQFVAAAKG